MHSFALQINPQKFSTEAQMYEIHLSAFQAGGTHPTYLAGNLWGLDQDGTSYGVQINANFFSAGFLSG